MSFFKKKKKGVTAGELMDRLNKDPEYLARKAAKNKEHAKRVAINHQFVAEVLDDLKGAGCKVTSLEQLLDHKEDYIRALPILLHALVTTDKVEFKRIIVQFLCVPWVKSSAPSTLIHEFEKTNNPSLRWQIGNALDVVADDSSFEDICRLARNTLYGKEREMVTLALANMRNPLAVIYLRELLKDEVVCGHAVMALGKLRAKEAYREIFPLLDHPKEWVREEARKTLALIKAL